MYACPCGYYGDPLHECNCSQREIDRYLGKISFPLLDRIDIHLEVAPVDYVDLKREVELEKSHQVKKRVINAREIQLKRFKNKDILNNSQMSNKEIKFSCRLDKATEKIMKMAFEKYKFSARTYNKILKLSRTIADLEGSKDIESAHLLEAIRYRSLNDKYWG